jgi:hypothetical protein
MARTLDRGWDPSLYLFPVRFCMKSGCSGGRERQRQNTVGSRLLHIPRDPGPPLVAPTPPRRPAAAAPQRPCACARKPERHGRRVELLVIALAGTPATSLLLLHLLLCRGCCSYSTDRTPGSPRHPMPRAGEGPHGLKQGEHRDGDDSGGSRR